MAILPSKLNMTTMDAMNRKMPVLLISALLCGPVALAQNSTRQMLKPNTTPTVIPVWNVHSGQIEALLVLEAGPQSDNRAWVKAAKDPNVIWPNQKPQGVNLDSGLAIFCSGQANSFDQLSLLGDCALGKKSSQYPAINSPSLETKALLQRKSNPVDRALLSGLSNKERQLLATEFDAPQATPGKSLNLSPGKATEGWVSINGNLTRGKLIPASQFPKGVPTEWDRKTFELPERQKSLTGEVVGNVVQIPGQDSNIQSIGAGLSWKTPWKGKVSVGAESILSQGRSTNSTSTQAPIVDQRIDGVTPYVRVEIDL
jgi:hypothetical protein